MEFIKRIGEKSRCGRSMIYVVIDEYLVELPFRQPLTWFETISLGYAWEGLGGKGLGVLNLHFLFRQKEKYIK